MNMFSNRNVTGALAGTLLTLSLVTSGSAAPLSVAAPGLVAAQTQIVDAKYVRHQRVVRHYRRYPGIGPVIGGLLAFGLGAALRPSCDYYYYYDYPYYCGPYSGPSYYYGPTYRYGYRYHPGFRGRVFAGRPAAGGVFRGGIAPGSGGFARGSGGFARGSGGFARGGAGFVRGGGGGGRGGHR